MGFKLHTIINNKGEIMAIRITTGNKSDISQASMLSKGLSGTIYGDKGYISKNLFAQLWSTGLRIITSIRKDMKNHLLEIKDKLLLRKRVLIESVLNVLKNSMRLEHTRHRSPINYFIHIIACVNAFAIKKLLNSNKKFMTIQNSLS